MGDGRTLFSSERCVAILLLLCIWFFQQQVFAADIELAEDSTLEGILARGKLRVGFEAGYLPFEMVDIRTGVRKRAVSHGALRHGSRHLKYMGFDIDIATEMAKELGVKLVLVETLWPSIIPALNLGRFDIIMSGMSVTERRKRQVDFADPLMTVGQTILLNTKHRDKVTSYKDLNDPRYVVVSKPGTTGEEAVKKYISKSTYWPALTESDGVALVVNDQADAFVYDLPYNSLYMAINGNENLVFLDKTFTVESIAWAIRKNDQDFKRWLNLFLKQIKNDGRYDAIYNRWFNKADWVKFIRE